MKFMAAVTISLLSLVLIPGPQIVAEKYRIDTEGAHASINFKVKHLGYSWLTGRFEKFSGTFDFNPSRPEKSHIEVTVKTASIDTSHAERDRHLRGAKYLDSRKYPVARFVSTRYQKTGNHSGNLYGKLTLHGVTRPVSMKVKQVGAGKDPWGNFRRGYESHFSIHLHDYGIRHKLGSASEQIDLTIYIEGIKDDKYVVP